MVKNLELAEILDNLDEGIIVLGLEDSELIVQYYNKVELLTKIFNRPIRSRNHLNDLFRYDNLTVQYGNLRKKIIKAITSQAIVKINELEIKSNDGILSYFTIKIKPVSSKIAILSIWDNTVNVKLDRSLNETSLKYSKLFSEAPLGISIQRNGQLIFVNNEWCNIYGYEKRGDAIGMRISSFFPDDIAKHIEDMAIRREKGSTNEPITYEVLSKRKDGTIVPTRFHISQVDMMGESFNIAFIKDISHEKQVEEQDKIRNSIENIGRVARSIVHDMNNLLTIISMNLFLLEHEPEISDVGQEGVIGSKEALTEANSLLKKLRSLTKQSKIDMQLLDFSRLIFKVYDIIRTERNSQVKLNINTDGEIRFFGDELHFEQIFLRLLENSLEAIDASSQNRNFEITINIQQLHDLTTYKEKQIKIEFIDNGIGMDETVLNQIFDPFYTTKDKNKSSFSSGLGLSIVYTLVVNQYNGSIQVDSTENNGTKITIQLPMYQNELIGKNKPIVYKDNKNIHGKEKILVIDDNPYLRNNLMIGLKHLGYTVELASDGLEGLKKLESITPDLIILDLLMPNMSGFEFLENYKKSQKIPFIICSGYHEDEINTEIVQNYTYLSKPFNLGELGNYIRATLEQKASSKIKGT